MTLSKSSSSNSTECRLCGADAVFVFYKTLLGRLDVSYYECGGCGSLQTEEPYWLDEAYSFHGSNIDSGRALRVIQSWIRLSYILQSIEFDRSDPCVDFGGANGLLTRLMRDCGYNYLSYDRYAESEFATYFDIKDLEDTNPALISAIEVVEHLENPLETLGEILSRRPDIFLFTTTLYEGQGQDWDYLVPISGQHIFLYTQRALEEFAAERGYQMIRLLGFWIMVSRSSRYLSALQDVDPKKFSIPVLGKIVRTVGGQVGVDRRQADAALAMEIFTKNLLDGRESLDEV